jgi:hypothetical protein
MDAKKFNFSGFEPVSVAGEEKLIGGFSTAFSLSVSNQTSGGESNNCLGGNCAYVCGSSQNIKCNTAAGCS